MRGVAKTRGEDILNIFRLFTGSRFGWPIHVPLIQGYIHIDVPFISGEQVSFPQVMHKNKKPGILRMGHRDFVLRMRRNPTNHTIHSLSRQVKSTSRNAKAGRLPGSEFNYFPYCSLGKCGGPTEAWARPDHTSPNPGNVSFTQDVIDLPWCFKHGEIVWWSWTGGILFVLESSPDIKL